MARHAWQGIRRKFIRRRRRGAGVSGENLRRGRPGRHPYRDGSYDYYVGEKLVTNDPKGVGAFLMAAVEMGA